MRAIEALKVGSMVWSSQWHWHDGKLAKGPRYASVLIGIYGVPSSLALVFGRGPEKIKLGDVVQTAGFCHSAQLVREHR